jgi:hypothetical protein
MCIPGWPQTSDPPASASWMLGLQAHATMLGLCLCFYSFSLCWSFFWTMNVFQPSELCWTFWSVLTSGSFFECFFGFYTIICRLHIYLTDKHTCLQNTPLVLLISGVFPTQIPQVYVHYTMSPHIEFLHVISHFGQLILHFIYSFTPIASPKLSYLDIPVAYPKQGGLAY